MFHRYITASNPKILNTLDDFTHVGPDDEIRYKTILWYSTSFVLKSIFLILARSTSLRLSTSFPRTFTTRAWCNPIRNKISSNVSCLTASINLAHYHQVLPYTNIWRDLLSHCALIYHMLPLQHLFHPQLPLSTLVKFPLPPCGNFGIIFKRLQNCLWLITLKRFTTSLSSIRHLFFPLYGAWSRWAMF